MGLAIDNQLDNVHWIDFLHTRNPKITNKFITWEEAFPFVLWAIWRNRNENNVNNTSNHINTTNIINQTLEYHLLTSKSTTNNIKVKLKVKWQAPARSWYKLNLDGAFNNSCLHEGVSGIIRNNKGEWILGYYDKYPTTSPNQAELQALWHALQIIIKENIFPVEVKTDTTEVIRFLYEDYPTYNDLIHECRWLMDKATQQGKITMNHSFREGNMVAHQLAKEALMSHNYNKTCYFVSPPIFAMDAYCKDQDGHMYVRSCSINVCSNLAAFFLIVNQANTRKN
uniref:RNase H type-1 domain-containing protein n=1 Tax=Nicotiana tabacum TaxID=4097 RepID=A0A1S3Y3D3_TOBAC|nr:PREDICTED: uncharacterized protein LOC107771788 [Nicotiana tabacum]